jgi:tetratricopeptide (TPR) repeat protein
VIALLEKLSADSPGEPDYLLDLSEAYSAFSPQRLAEPRKSAEIEQYLLKAIKLSEQLNATHPNVPDYEFSQGQIRLKWGTFLRVSRRAAAAEEQLRLAVGAQSALARRFPDVARFRVWLAAYQGSLAELLSEASRWEEALALMETATGDLEKLLKAGPNRRYAREALSEAYTRLALVHEQSGSPTHAAEARERAKALSVAKDSN